MTAAESLKIHQDFNRMFGGDNEFEGKVIAFLKHKTGTESLLRMPISLLQNAVKRPMAFRMAVEEYAETQL